MKFASEEWAQELMTQINNSEAYESAAKTWEGDMYLIISDIDKYVYLDLWHGKCKSAFAAEDMSQKESAFKLTANKEVWQKVCEGKIHPMTAMATRKMKAQGNMMMIMKHTKGAIELVECTKRIDTDFGG